MTAKMREAICTHAKSLFMRGLTHGSTGNISVRLDDGSLLVTPTGSSFGFLDPAELSHVSVDGKLLAGKQPTKEMPLHTSFYKLRDAHAGAVVHLHSHYSVVLSVMTEVDPEDMLPPLTPYAKMQLGRVKRVPYFAPGDPALGDALESLPRSTTAVILANHGPIVAGPTLETAVFAMEELEASARLAVDTQTTPRRSLTSAQLKDLARTFNLQS